MDKQKEGRVRTRFAPSPTGFMHVGGVRTALFAWLVARQGDGQFLLRIEDTDRERHIKEAEQHILDSLHWLGLNWDGEVYRQSENLEVYKQWAQKLVDRGRAYADPRGEDDLKEARAESKALKEPFLYRNFRPQSPPVWDGTQPLRLKSEPKAYAWHDEVMGNLSTGPEVIDDFIIMKSDGYPTYNFAHIVDDHLMGISHVMRSQEFASSIPKYLNLYEALEIERPKLATLPYVLAPDGRKKLSKREGAQDVLAYKQKGFLPETLINFLATLGWNDGTEQEIFSVEELIKKFDLARVQRSGAHFDEQRLNWMNGHYIRELPLKELSKKAGKFWSAEAKSAAPEYKTAVLGLIQERLKFLAELSDLSQFFFTEPDIKGVVDLFSQPVDKQLKNLSAGEIIQLLKAVKAKLNDSDFSEEDIANRLNNSLKELGSKPGVLFAAVRIAVTGSAVSPQLFGTLAVLGKERSQGRLEKALTALEKQA